MDHRYWASLTSSGSTQGAVIVNSITPSQGQSGARFQAEVRSLSSKSHWFAGNVFYFCLLLWFCVFYADDVGEESESTSVVAIADCIFGHNFDSISGELVFIHSTMFCSSFKFSNRGSAAFRNSASVICAFSISIR